MDAGILCNKEMVDLLMRMKKHLKLHHQVTLNLSDPHLMASLLDLATLKDDVLQGMMQYLMALAGKEWSERYLSAAKKSAPAVSAKSLTEKLRDKLLADTSMVSSRAPIPVAVPTANLADSSTRVRYYRGQPIYG